MACKNCGGWREHDLRTGEVGGCDTCDEEKGEGGKMKYRLDWKSKNCKEAWTPVFQNCSAEHLVDSLEKAKTQFADRPEHLKSTNDYRIVEIEIVEKVVACHLPARVESYHWTKTEVK